MRAGLLLAIMLFGCSSCSVIEQPYGLIPRWTTQWRQVATDDDRLRLSNWRASFIAALDAAKKGGHQADIIREGVLLEPDAALGAPAIPNGIFRCRVIKMGAKPETNSPTYDAFAPFMCEVSADRGLQRFNKFGGEQRYVGLLFPGDSIHQIFLGTLVLGDEKQALQYGQDQFRDIAGYVERIGPNRWRLLMPKPHFESQFDVMELIPSSDTPRQGSGR